MAGVRRLKELSTMRASRGMKSFEYDDNDDDSRPISPDKQVSTGHQMLARHRFPHKRFRRS